MPQGGWGLSPPKLVPPAVELWCPCAGLPGKSLFLTFYNEDSGLTESCDCSHEIQGRAPLKVYNAGNSLAVQWLGLCAFTTGAELIPWLGN